MTDDFEKIIKQSFLEETIQLLVDAELCFLQLETNSEDPEILSKLFRLAHNIKGGARAVGFNKMAEFGHELENLLLKLKKKEEPISSATITLLLKCNDHLRTMVEQLKRNPQAEVENAELLRELAFHDQENSPVRTDVYPLLEKVTAAIAEDSVQQERIRVSLKKLDMLINNVGELVIMQTMLSQYSQTILNPVLEKTVLQLSKITNEIQDISISLRMIPLRQTFQKMQRIVRDTSKSLNKEIKLEVVGEDTEMDKTILEGLSDPLLHLIRNSIDHGIETPEERVAAGKPAFGQIHLSASHRGNHVVLEIRDDGRGLDPKLIRQKGIERGIISPQQEMNEMEIFHLIFQPGFSTRSEVTDLSGRGIGMDVVKTNIEKKLGGQIQFESEWGKGCCFRILLPLTISIIEGMVVRVGGEKYVLSLSQIHETLRLSPENVHHVTGLGDILSLRKEELPLLRLQSILGRGSSGAKSDEGIALIVRAAEKPFAIAVDNILGRQQVVIKRLGKEVQNIRGFSGCAILGDGRATIILDLVELVARNFNPFRESQERFEQIRVEF